MKSKSFRSPVGSGGWARLEAAMGKHAEGKQEEQVIERPAALPQVMPPKATKKATAKK